MEHRIPYEFRTTLVKEFHDEKAIREIGKWLKGADHYYLQNFKKILPASFKADYIVLNQMNYMHLKKF